ncbi:helix-turn-helix domain-containing protein [Haladaptatus sp. CMAA 1911]|uniref:helix-turn-helix domain-containing protein n=1 Tax=unclassified Haladaptatus TaxID=2622732 RepID=UPI0037550A26
MRHLTVLLDPGEHKLVSVFDEMGDERVKREYLHHYNLLTDGTVVSLYQLRGDLDHARAVFDESTDVVHYDIPEQEDGFVYLHSKISESLTVLLSALQESEVIMAMPIKFLSDDRLRVTFIGEHEPMNRLLDITAEYVNIEIERVSKYGSGDRLSSVLTERQQEILTTAVEQGYYEVPRQARIRDVADVLNLSQATVGEHLQKIEARVLSSNVR